MDLDINGTVTTISNISMEIPPTQSQFVEKCLSFYVCQINPVHQRTCTRSTTRASDQPSLSWKHAPTTQLVHLLNPVRWGSMHQVKNFNRNPFCWGTCM